MLVLLRIDAEIASFRNGFSNMVWQLLRPSWLHPWTFICGHSETSE